ncbi:tetratricopeptide repeat protein [Desulfococcaceae bacterium HSG8]|nr:tetratricopeptide repeat protein [Desulfococcaceae bacterium HSG8]
MAFEHIVRSYDEEARDTSPDAAFRVLSGKQALLMLDGTEEAEDLHKVLRVRGNCGVIVTSRTTHDAPAEWQDITPLEHDRAVELIRAWGGNFVPDDALAGEICDLVGRLPLAVRLAGRYLAHRRQENQAEKYLAWLRESPLKALDRGKRREESVPLLLERSLEQVSGEARQVLSVCGMLSLNPFHEDVIAGTLGMSPFEADDCLGELVNYGLLVPGGERYQVSHALIHTYSRKELAPDTEVIRKLAGYYVTFAREQGRQGGRGYARLDEERAHIMKITEACKDRGEWDSVTALVWAVDNYLDTRGYLTERLAMVTMGADAARESGDKQEESFFLNSMGICCANMGSLNEAVQHFSMAIELMQGLRTLLEPRGEWPPQMTNDLAAAFMNRGVAFANQGRYEEAVQHFSMAIELMQGLRTLLEPRGEWPPQMTNDLAAAFMNRGIAYKNQGRNEEAVQDYGRAIELTEGLRTILEPRGEWPPQMTNDLAAAFMNRGIAYKNQGRNEEAVQDCGRAIELTEGLRTLLEPRGEWPPQMTDDLAAAFMNRGVAYWNQGRYEEAAKDYGMAIELRQGLKTLLEPRGEWPPQMTNSLAAAFMNRGVAYRNQGRNEEATKDCGRAIELMEGLKTLLEPRGEWPSQMTDDLAAAFISRGAAYWNQGRNEEAAKDYGMAIELMEGLVFQARFPSAIPDLAKAFYNLLLLLEKTEPGEAVSRASAFLENLSEITDINALPESWKEPLENLKQLIRKIRNRPGEITVSIPPPHPSADPKAAARLNIAYHEELKKYRKKLAEYKRLPFWKRFRTPKPEKPRKPEEI